MNCNVCTGAKTLSTPRPNFTVFTASGYIPIDITRRGLNIKFRHVWLRCNIMQVTGENQTKKFESYFISDIFCLLNNILPCWKFEENCEKVLCVTEMQFDLTTNTIATKPDTFSKNLFYSTRDWHWIESRIVLLIQNTSHAFSHLLLGPNAVSNVNGPVFSTLWSFTMANFTSKSIADNCVKRISLKISHLFYELIKWKQESICWTILMFHVLTRSILGVLIITELIRREFSRSVRCVQDFSILAFVRIEIWDEEQVEEFPWWSQTISIKLICIRILAKKYGKIEKG